jgi:DNA-binding PadR family transcriptional regulator
MPALQRHTRATTVEQVSQHAGSIRTGSGVESVPHHAPQSRGANAPGQPRETREAAEPTAHSPSGTLDLALLGLLADAPMHGYELRSRLIELLGTVRSYSYGSLYPALRRLEAAELIAVEQPLIDPDSVPLTSKRRRLTYHITATGKEHLDTLLAEAGPQAATDEGFGVHLAFFPKTTVDARLRILQARRRRIEERREGLRTSMTRAVQRMDDYTLQLHELAMEASDREVKWLSDLISREEQLQINPDGTSPPG